MTKKTLKQNEIRITFAGRLKKRLIKILILQIAKSESKKEFFENPCALLAGGEKSNFYHVKLMRRR